MSETDKIRVIETLQEANHKAVIERLEDCLASVKDDPNINAVIICTENHEGKLRIYWSRCEDRMRLGSRLVYAGFKRMGFNADG